MLKKPQFVKPLASIMYHGQLSKFGVNMDHQPKKKSDPQEGVDVAWAIPMKLMRNFYSGFYASRTKGHLLLGMQYKLRPDFLFGMSVLNLKLLVVGLRSFSQGIIWPLPLKCRHRIQVVSVVTSLKCALQLSAVISKPKLSQWPLRREKNTSQEPMRTQT